MNSSFASAQDKENLEKLNNVLVQLEKNKEMLLNSLQFFQQVLRQLQQIINSEQNMNAVI